jgi:diguanylate cyclase (GGDEF)-like protein
MENADSIIKDSLAKQSLCAVLYMDLDKFKSINDTYGHELGDNVLRHVATAIKSVLKSSDLLARIGGDEFAAVLSNLKEIKQVDSIIKRIIEKVGEQVIISDMIISVNISIGVSIAPTNGDKLSLLLKKADYALYKAKEVEGSLYKFYTDDIEQMN